MTTLRDRICLIVSELLESIMSHENRSKETIDALEALFAEERARRDGQWAHELGKVGLGKDKFDSVLATLQPPTDTPS